MNTFSYFLKPHTINVLLYRMKPRKHIHVKYCWQTYFKSIGTLSQTFENHIHKTLKRSLASDVFRVPLTFSCQRTVILAGKPARLPKGWNMIFISRNMIFVLCGQKEKKEKNRQQHKTNMIKRREWTQELAIDKWFLLKFPS
jgi:hypothetical protein